MLKAIFGVGFKRSCNDHIKTPKIVLTRYPSINDKTRIETHLKIIWVANKDLSILSYFNITVAELRKLWKELRKRNGCNCHGMS
jgi:hypothetical protein